MARRTRFYRVSPWVGGVNTSVDSGVLNSQELVTADNVVFSSAGARIKREALEYLDPAVPAPDFRSSSGTTRTLKWTTNALVNITSLNERLVVGERITVAGVTNYAATDVAILSRTSIPQVTSVVCTADVSGSLNNKYFLISAGDDGTDYYVWFNVSGGGSDPALTGKTAIPVAISTNDTDTTVAEAVKVAVDALSDFAASRSSATVTITNALGGLTGDSTAGNSGFTVTDTTKGGHSITYTGGSSLSESITAAGSITVARASAIIMNHDYWRYDDPNGMTQAHIYATDDFQLFSLDTAGRRTQVLGQGQVTSVVCGNAASLTTGDYFLLSAANDATNYYVWYNKAAGGGDPAVSSRTGIEVAIGAGDTATQVATATKNAINGVTNFTADSSTDTVTITNANAGITTEATDSNTGFTITTTTLGATAPTTAVSTIRAIVFNERIIIFFSGLGNVPIKYNPDDSTKYQLLHSTAPDASFGFVHQGRIWCNDKTNRDGLHYCETFDETLWLGFGDSGFLPINPGDGDSEGVINGYSYKGFLVVGKKAARYRVLGDSPESYYVEVISKGMGSEGTLAIPVDETDVVFLSKRGIHSQAATDNYGDTDTAYLSAKIKPTFQNWAAGRLKLTQGTYIPELNSIALSIAEEGQDVQSAIWLYNIEVDVPGAGRGAWYRWPNLSCQSLSRRYVNNQYKLVFGTADGRLVQAQDTGSYSDYGTDGIEYKIRTGTIYPDDDIQGMKVFKSLTMIYRPRGNFSFLVKAYVDNFPAQSFSFNQISGVDLLGTTFVLGTSLLGSNSTLAPYSFTMDGVGRGVVLEITQPSADEQVEIWGFVLEYEPAGIEEEVKT